MTDARDVWADIAAWAEAGGALEPVRVVRPGDEDDDEAEALARVDEERSSRFMAWLATSGGCK